MKTKEYKKNMMYMGAGCGLVLFTIFGLLPGSFLGGVMGLNVAGMLTGTPVSGLAARMIVAASMMAGVMVSAIMCITASTTAGWLAGSVLEALMADRKKLAGAESK